MASVQWQRLTQLAAVAALMIMFCLVQPLSASQHHHHNHDKYSGHLRPVYLRDVEVLTLNSGEMTTARRSAPVPQMSCIGGSAGCRRDLLPQTMQCKNVGWDGVDVQWQCQAEVDKSVKLGRTTVTCEGFEHPDDPYILAGSCGVEYTLDNTGHYSSRHGHYSGSHRYESGSTGNNWFLIIVAAVFAYQLYKWCTVGRGATAHGGDPMGRRFDGGHFGGPHGGPPPDYPGGPSGPGCSPPPYSSLNTNTGGGWNFWHGFGLGGVLGAMLAPRRQYNAYGSMYRPRWGANDYGTGYGGGSYRSSSPSTGSHTSTGYGGTRRR